jgi:hypothetical protein
MRNNKIKRAGFNLRIQAVIIDNWRFLAAICRVLSREYGWGEKRLNRWVDEAAEYCNSFNEHDKDGIYRIKLEQLERQNGGVISWQRVADIVRRNTTLKSPAEIDEIIDNLDLQLNMTVREFDGVGRERLIAGLEALSREEIDQSPDYIKEKYGVELDTSFQDYWQVMKERRGVKERVTYTEAKAARANLEAFRKWSGENNPGEG